MNQTASKKSTRSMKNKKEGGTTEGATLTFVRIDFSAGRPTHRRYRGELSSNLEEDAANDPLAPTLKISSAILL